jgi:type IV secretory pathway ATPase VirB11/archaellum biosynthesis ATPase
MEASMISLDQMVERQTISAEGAALLRSIGTEGASFLVYSLPRNAGKSTLTEAILAGAPSDLARHDFEGTPAETAALLSRPADGYVVVAEIGHRGRPGYLADEEVVRTFELVNHGYALASSLHADTVEQVYAVLADNGVTASAVSGVRYLIKIQPLDDPFHPETRRVVEAVHEVKAGTDGRHRLATQIYGDLDTSS